MVINNSSKTRTPLTLQESVKMYRNKQQQGNEKHHINKYNLQSYYKGNIIKLANGMHRSVVTMNKLVLQALQII